MVHTEIRKLAFLGNYLPRKCGIATFTSDLHSSIAGSFANTRCFVVPVNDLDCGYEYPAEVRFEIPEPDLLAYRRAADFLNLSNVDVISLQHEFGIFGGPAGSHLLALVRDLKMPMVTTFHTLLREPNPDQRRVMHELVHQSTRVVVMTRRGQEILEEVYQTPSTKIDVIPHGIPDVPFIDPNYFKDQFGVEGKLVLLTFGLLSPNKGIENVLNAMPEILAEFPNVVYIVLGATHPNLVRDQGEAYRTRLERIAKKNRIEKSVIFYNRFVDIEELKEFIGAADIYVTPYLSEAQITSGTLAYAFGAGKAIVSTPYWHAQELLSDDRGALVPFADPQAIARQVIDLLRDERRRHSMRKNAYKMGREMVWSHVGEMYMKSFAQARVERAGISRKVFAIKTLDQQPRQLPELKLDHLQRMTDSTGMFQHAKYSVPNLAEGYCTDDNARALMLTVLLEELGEDSPQVRGLATRYAAFVHHAYNSKARRFRNFMSFDRRWLEESGSEDCNGRALWALGMCVGRSRRSSFQNLAGDLFHRALASATELKAPRAWAFSLLGIQEYLQRLSGDRLAEQIRDSLTGRLIQLFEKWSSEDWTWCEQEVTYDNSRLAQALIQCGAATGQQNATEWGLRALRWLTEIQTSEEGHFRPIGCKGFFCRNGHRAQFDQQPIEACAMISACVEAYRVTSDPFWQDQATRAFDWFLGWNDLGLELYSYNSGGCYDGLHVDRVNMNQGAESTLAFLTSLAEMKLMHNAVASSNESSESTAAAWNPADNSLELEKVGFTDNFAPAVKHR
ncbi:MAG TPA: glycosyltransferase family 4 protein [Verrucomicrobiae bacterium]|nr:glycosyltransferase family 4 protein [Verrucomicrobiae bacterium]